jgi:hypothetical protein
LSKDDAITDLGYIRHYAERLEEAVRAGPSTIDIIYSQRIEELASRLTKYVGQNAEAH